MTTVLISLGIMFGTLVIMLVTLFSGWWNFIDAIAHILHRAANRGRRKQHDRSLKLLDLWITEGVYNHMYYEKHLGPQPADIQLQNFN